MEADRLWRSTKGSIDEGMAVARHIGGEHPDLAVGDLARRPGILTPDPAGRLALLEKAGLVYHQHGIIIGQRFQGKITHDVPEIVGIPASTPENRLLSPRTGIAGRFGAHPTRLAPLFAKQAIQKQSG